MSDEEKKQQVAMVVGAMGGTLLGGIATLLLARPAKAAPPEEKLDYLIELTGAILGLLQKLAEGNATIIDLLQKIAAAQGVPPEGVPPVEVTVKTKWAAAEPEQIFSQPILSTGTFYADKMVDWRQGKRIYFLIQSTLNQNVQIQVIGNATDMREGATDIGPAQLCPANDNTSVGPAWDQWCPYIGIKIVVTVAPTSGLLTITAVKQE